MRKEGREGLNVCFCPHFDGAELQMLSRFHTRGTWELRIIKHESSHEIFNSTKGDVKLS